VTKSSEAVFGRADESEVVKVSDASDRWESAKSVREEGLHGKGKKERRKRVTLPNAFRNKE
jgi:hypothetical protein